MGWLWSTPPSTPPPPSKGPDGQDSSKPSPSQREQSAKAEIAADPEIAKFLAQLEAEFGVKGSSGNDTNTQKPVVAPAEPAAESRTDKPSSSSAGDGGGSSWSFLGSWSSSSSSSPPPATNNTSQRQQAPTTPTTSTTSPAAATTTETGPALLDPLSEALLPTTMSCRDAWDRAYHCNSLGGQWTAVYREGTVRSCSELWDDFWFCMRARGMTGEVKTAAIQDYYRKREYDRYFKPGVVHRSSTEIWEMRTEKVRDGEAFQQPLHMPDISDEEWRRLEIERRKRVQAALAAEDAAAAAAGSSSS